MNNIKKLLTLSLVVALFAGCQDELAPIEEGAVIQKQLKNGNKGVTELVTGSGHIHRDYGDVPDVWRTFSIHATKKADGTVTGKYQINDHGAGVSIKGDVICFNTFENKAVLIVEWQQYKGEGEDPYWPLGYIVVEDNKATGEPDRISLHHAEGWEWLDEDCGILYPEDQVPRYPIESGNITVH